MSVFGRTLLIHGPEPLLGARAAQDRVAVARRELPEAQLNRIEAADLDGNTLAEVTGGSLFSAQSITVINDIGSTPPELIDSLVNIATNPASELALVLIHGGGVKGKALLGRLKKASVDVVEIAPVKPWETVRFVMTESRRLGLRWNAEVSQALVAAVGNDIRALSAAVAQLAADTAGESIDIATIQRYFAGRAEVTAYQVVDAVIEGNTSLALERLRWALGTGVSPVLITSSIAVGLRGIARYLEALKLRLNDYDLAKQIGVPTFKVKEFYRTSRGWNPNATAAALLEVAKADAQVKGAASDPHFALERLIINVIAKRNL